MACFVIFALLVLSVPDIQTEFFLVLKASSLSEKIFSFNPSDVFVKNFWKPRFQFTVIRRQAYLESIRNSVILHAGIPFGRFIVGGEG